MDWGRKSLHEKIAAVMWPEHASQSTRDQMAGIARAHGKRAPSGPALLPDHKRGSVSPLGGTAVKSSTQRSK
jgi:hypothetical protein